MYQRGNWLVQLYGTLDKWFSLAGPSIKFANHVLTRELVGPTHVNPLSPQFLSLDSIRSSQKDPRGGSELQFLPPLPYPYSVLAILGLLWIWHFVLRWATSDSRRLPATLDKHAPHGYTWRLINYVATRLWRDGIGMPMLKHPMRHPWISLAKPSGCVTYHAP